MRFEPEVWARVHDDARPTASQLRFRHLADAARAEVLRCARAGESWLDIGSGTGHLAAELAAARLNVFGIDNDPAMVAAASARFGGAERVRFGVGDAAALGFGDETFDGVVATSLVGCLPDATPFFAEAGRVIRPGGHAVLTFTNRASLLNALERRLGGRPSPFSAPAARGYTVGEAKRELEAAGLRVARVRFVNWFVSAGKRAFPPTALAFRLEGSVGSLIAWNLVVVARKA